MKWKYVAMFSIVVLLIANGIASALMISPNLINSINTPGNGETLQYDIPQQNYMLVNARQYQYYNGYLYMISTNSQTTTNSLLISNQTGIIFNQSLGVNYSPMFFSINQYGIIIGPESEFNNTSVNLERYNLQGKNIDTISLPAPDQVSTHRIMTYPTDKALFIKQYTVDPIQSNSTVSLFMYEFQPNTIKPISKGNVTFNDEFHDTIYQIKDHIYMMRYSFTENKDTNLYELFENGDTWQFKEILTLNEKEDEFLLYMDRERFISIKIEYEPELYNITLHNLNSGSKLYITDLTIPPFFDLSNEKIMIYGDSADIRGSELDNEFYMYEITITASRFVAFKYKHPANQIEGNWYTIDLHHEDEQLIETAVVSESGNIHLYVHKYPLAPVFRTLRQLSPFVLFNATTLPIIAIYATYTYVKQNAIGQNTPSDLQYPQKE